MLRARVIPCLLLHQGGLYKTIKFQKPKYIGDPINAVRIFNDKEVDELIVLDIDVTIEDRPIDFALIERIAAQCFMPVGYGGGVRTVEDARRLFSLGVEKIVINSAAVEKPDLISELSRTFGAQAVVISIDVNRRAFSGRQEVFIRGGRKGTGLDPVKHAMKMEELGAGEIFINAIYKDGTMSGYDIALIKSISSAVSVPVIASGGAASSDDIVRAIKQGGASAAAAGALFVYQSRGAGVLINYVNQQILMQKLADASARETEANSNAE